jgi:hypothetical protein
MKTHGIGLGLLMLLAGSTSAGQSTQDAGNGPATNGAKPAASAQDTTNSTAEKKKPKKVWTNDEIGSAKGAISVVGDSNASGGGQGQRKSEGVASGTADAARNQQIENYRNQIQQIHSQMDEIDKRIAQLKNFKGENNSPSGGININQGYNMVPLEDQVKQLEEKKRQLAAKIDNIELEAEKKGIDPGDLR